MRSPRAGDRDARRSTTSPRRRRRAAHDLACRRRRRRSALVGRVRADPGAVHRRRASPRGERGARARRAGRAGAATPSEAGHRSSPWRFPTTRCRSCPTTGRSRISPAHAGGSSSPRCGSAFTVTRRARRAPRGKGRGRRCIWTAVVHARSVGRRAGGRLARRAASTSRCCSAHVLEPLLASATSAPTSASTSSAARAAPRRSSRRSIPARRRWPSRCSR